MKEKILILDFGSQYTQLIARRVREFNTYCEIIPYNKEFELEPSVKAIILSGSPFSVRQSDALRLDLKRFLGKLPVLAVCYGAQLIAQELGGEVSPSSTREYGKVELLPNTSDTIFEGVSASSQVWMSHSDTISRIPDGFEILATTRSIPVAAYRSKTGVFEHPVYAFQFHPEVTHSLEGLTMLQNFVNNIAGCQGQWSAASFIEETIENIKKTVGNEKVMMALSGGVDSTVAAELLHKAIGDRLFCFFVDNGLLRKNEFQEVLDSYRSMGLNIEGVDAKQEFLTELQGLTDPEAKRKAIGRVFIEIFEREAASHKDIHWLGQGTIYPDVIESVSVHGPSVTIKSHHNVGGLPEKMGFKVIEPLRYLFKDEVRRIGKALNIPEIILNRHPFPGPGLGIRILGDITEEKIAVLQEADAIYIQKLKESGWYSKVWQAGTILLPIHSVGVMGDERTYERVVALRAVSSVDGMTAEWSPLPHSLLAEISSDIINKVKGVNRVVYDISTKPPSTIEWE